MTREDLYSLAFRYRKTKLWLRLFDTQVFAVRTEKGETIFICIMGRMGEHISVAVYPENEFYSYNYISSSCIQCSFENKDMMHPSDLEEVREYARSQGIRIAGKNAFPLFTRYTPCMYPWVVNSEHDLELLAAGLEAAIALSRFLCLFTLRRDTAIPAWQRCLLAAVPPILPGTIPMKKSSGKSVRNAKKASSTAVLPG